jgi:hypothetical protein
MNVPPLQPRPIPPRSHWTEPVSREETLARREKFRKIGWLPPNHKPKTKKVIATVKRLWDKYVICGCRLYLCGVTVRTADGVLPGIVSILVSMPHLLESQHHDFESWIDWIHRTTKKKTHDSISVYRRRLCQVYSVLAKQPMDSFTTEQVRRYDVSHSISRDEICYTC